MQFISNTKTKRFICTETLATRIIYHLRVEPLFDADKYGMGCGGVGWAVTAHWHLQTKDGTHGLAHIHMEHGVGWGGLGCQRSLALASQGWHR